MPGSARTPNANRREEILDLLATAFDHAPRAYFESELDGDPQADPSQHLVVDEDGSLVAHLRVVERTMRCGRAEIPFGGIAGVATHPDHRDRGHAGALLDRAIDHMAARGLPLSLLFTLTHDVYTSRGWIAVEADHVTASRPEAAIAAAGGYVVRPFEPGHLAGVMSTYQDVSSGLVGPIVRAAEYWAGLQQWLPPKPPAGELFFDVVLHLGQVVAYAISKITADSLVILDAGVEYEALGRPLLATWQGRMREHDVTAITGRLHHRHPFFDLLAREAGATVEPQPGLMIRLNSLRQVLDAITPELSRRRVRAAPLPGPSFAFDVGGERVRIETPMGKVRIGDPRGDEPVLALDRSEFVHLLLGSDRGHEALASKDVPAQVRVYAERLFPNTGYQYWMADKF